MGDEEDRALRAKLRELQDWWEDPNPNQDELDVLSKIVQYRVMMPLRRVEEYTDLVAELLASLELAPKSQAAEAAKRLMGTDHEVMFSLLWNLEGGPKGARRFILGDISTNGLGDRFGLMEGALKGLDGALKGVEEVSFGVVEKAE